MKKIISFVFLGIFVFSLFFASASAEAATRVRGYTTGRGTYVMPHYRSTRDSYKFNNYSSKYNYNPYTGKKGYKNW